MNAVPYYNFEDNTMAHFYHYPGSCSNCYFDGSSFGSYLAGFCSSFGIWLFGFDELERG